jgi:copper resistance protein C
MRVARALVALLAALASAAAWGHAFLDHADPKVGSVVTAAPSELRIWFTQDVEPAFSSAEVVDANGKRVDAGRAHVDTNEHSLLHVPLAQLAPGEYTVTWRSVSVDTHVTQGRFTFKVAP